LVFQWHPFDERIHETDPTTESTAAWRALTLTNSERCG